MRLICTVCLVNRSFANAPVTLKRKHVKSTLALCKHPKSGEFCFILFSAQNKNGTKYDIKNNILKVLNRFVSEGKVTIQLKKPEHDLCIQAETIQIKSFLLLLKKVLENKVSAQEFMISSMSVTAINANDVAPKKLVVMKSSDYASKGLPRSLEILHMSGLKRCSLNRSVLLLVRLRTLDISDNLIEFLPEEINKLSNLQELNLNSNEFGKSAPRKWDWMGGNLSKSLKCLKLCNNHMKYVPNQIVKLYSLVSLSLDNNELTVLPSGIGNLRSLRILTAGSNQLSSLPGSVKKWRLEELDLSHNNFHDAEQNNPAAIFPKPLPVCTLKEYAAKRVLFARLSYNCETLPLTVIKWLDLAKYCVCGKACFDQFIKHPHMLSLSSVSKNISVSAAGIFYVPMECYLCSIKCFSSANYNRGRQPIVR
ncbi:PREDICTED: leucine-rich repeat protein 1 [Nicrophorus vespilloides]|uniref:Leucine-rich repeat protein 1 n=1 Tax=Nicrophorus vespilloides TaxID=110193 RepID=A0ABM1NB51_NICVS|nr:PREDICTED: leucine-rich repeat protein 1 [Nicrophorus vespilloides]